MKNALLFLSLLASTSLYAQDSLKTSSPYEAQIADCTKGLRQFSTENENQTFGFTKELRQVVELKNKGKDDSVAAQVLGDNIQISVTSPLDFEYYEAVKSIFIKNGLQLIYENNQVRNTPTINRDSKVAIFKKTNFNYSAEQKKINNFLENVDKTYISTAQCYSTIFKDKSIEEKKSYQYLGTELLRWKISQQTRTGAYFTLK